ncbi:MAG TPA: DUF4349 domain-containing protein [Gemmatimonadaceae bacterium]|jgi:hypothetical protein|nr:DUF4349 domain-containing protein [Gemmatimonadaceae bacterium]
MRAMLLVLVAVIAGCRQPGATPKDDMRLDRVAAASAPMRAEQGRTVAFATMADSASTAAASPMIIRTGEASIEVGAVDPAVGQVRELARSVGGYVANSSAQTGADNVKSATVQLKVPVERFDQVLTGLAPLGKVESVNVTAQDVGEEYVDVGARVANSRRLEERLIALLATRTGKLKDVLNVEQELSRVRGEIEQAEGRMRYLRTHAAVSTLDITVHEHAAVLADTPGEHPLRDAAHQAWRNFVGLIAAGIASLGVILPLGVVLAGVWFGVRRLRRPVGAAGA